MKKLYVLIAAFLLLFEAGAQQRYYSAALGFRNLSRKSSSWDGDGYYGTGSSKGMQFCPTLMVTRYTSVRRGISYGITPFSFGSYTYTAEAPDTFVHKVKTGGVLFHYGLFGDIGSDYLSKTEIQLSNNFCGGVSPQGIVIGADLGVSARYRLNKNMKLGLDFYPVNLYVYGYNIFNFCSPLNGRLVFSYAP